MIHLTIYFYPSIYPHISLRQPYTALPCTWDPFIYVSNYLPTTATYLLLLSIYLQRTLYLGSILPAGDEDQKSSMYLTTYLLLLPICYFYPCVSLWQSYLVLGVHFTRRGRGPEVVYVRVLTPPAALALATNTARGNGNGNGIAVGWG